MCANYRPSTRDAIHADLGLPAPAFDYAPEAFPGSNAPLLVQTADDAQASWREAMFGLVPFWSKDTRISRQTYNARSETVAEKPSYRGPWRQRQFALVPMACFYEPCYESGKAVRWAIRRDDDQTFTAAAIWDSWRDADGARLFSFSMLTVNADGHPLMQRFHKPGDEKRSLVIVDAGNRADWLRADEATARELMLAPLSADFGADADPMARRT